MGWMYNNLGTAPTFIDINVKTLSNMFIALYNSTYDSLEDSGTILAYLTQSPFNDRIVAGVPASVKVSHKIGENASDKTYSDCGVVYAPNRPYVLCVGSSGADKATATKFMAEVSGAAYQYVIKN